MSFWLDFVAQLWKEIIDFRNRLKTLPLRAPKTSKSQLVVFTGGTIVTEIVRKIKVAARQIASCDAILILGAPNFTSVIVEACLVSMMTRFTIDVFVEFVRFARHQVRIETAPNRSPGARHTRDTRVILTEVEISEDLFEYVSAKVFHRNGSD